VSAGSWRNLRFVKFALVGGLGIGVQLAVLAALTAIRMNYLAATLLAVESAVVHNFCWHQSFTWADRAAGEAEIAGWLKRLARFQLSNGAISIVGNLLMMRLLVGFGHLPIIVANGLSITACCVANFVASDRWVFLLHSSWERVEEGSAGRL
jgi:putative flippase GtrA